MRLMHRKFKCDCGKKFSQSRARLQHDREHKRVTRILIQKFYIATKGKE